MPIETNEAGTPQITTATLRDASRHEMRKFCKHNNVAHADAKTATLRNAIAAYLSPVAPEPTPEPQPAADPAATIAALEAKIAALQAAAAAPRAAAPKGVSHGMMVRAERTLALALAGEAGAHTDETGMLVLTPAALLAGGWSTAYATLTNGWGRTKPAGMAFAALGWAYRGRVVLQGETIETSKGLRTPHLVRLQQVVATAE